MSTLCEGCSGQLQISLSCIPKKWRDQIVASICRLATDDPHPHCEVDFKAYLCQLPEKWRDDLIKALCTAFTLSKCSTDCERCQRVFSTYMLNWPPNWRKLIITAICNIIDCNGCPEDSAPCVTYLITSSTGVDADYEYTYRDCDNTLQAGTIGLGDHITICAIRGTVEINNNFLVVEVLDTCNLSEENCYCFTLTNVETETGIISYKYSYTNCDGDTFTDQSDLADPGSFTTICARPTSIATNFGFSLVKTGLCTDCDDTHTPDGI